MSWSRRWAAIVGLVVSLTTLVGCGGSSDEAERGFSRQVGGPTLEFDVPEQDPEMVEVGSGLFAANCAGCHGADVRGTDLGPSLLSEVYEPGHHADGAFQVAVQRGVRAHHWEFGDMPPIPGLSPDDVATITAFIRDQQRTEGFEPYG